MVKVHSKVLNASIEINRIIGHITGTEPGATLVFIAGIHGNEPSGVFALKKVLKNISSNNIPFKGNCYALAGNLNALEAGVRYQKEDLNRIWTSERINAYSDLNSEKQSAENLEMLQVLETIREIMEKENGPFYFIDLHTTSSETKPFITINDMLLNRKFAQQFPVPILLGIEEYLGGTLLNYINQLGYLAIGFESGQHDELVSIENHTAFIYLTLFFSGSIQKNDLQFDAHFNLLAKTAKNLSNNFEIVYHYKIEENEEFKMVKGFSNFELIKGGQYLASTNSQIINAPFNGNIFMPLYQQKGDDGFFIIKPVKSIFLSLSTVLRKLHLDYLFPILPGISWASNNRDTLKVNLKTAKFFAKKIFHLLGYRSRQINEKYMVISNREAFSKERLYKTENWYTKR